MTFGWFIPAGCSAYTYRLPGWPGSFDPVQPSRQSVAFGQRLLPHTLQTIITDQATDGSASKQTQQSGTGRAKRSASWFMW